MTEITTPRKLRGHPDGMILMTTLVVMLLITILGLGMLFATRSELSTTTNYRQSIKAFNNADAVVQLAIRAVDVIANGTVEDVRDHLAYNSANSDYKIEVTSSLENLIADMSPDRLSTKRRYLGVGSAAHTTPDLIIRDKQNRVVGTVVISHDFTNGSVPFAGGGVGSSGQIADKGNTGVGGVSLQYYVITVSGKDPTAPGTSNFFR
ncbi:MAG: hypothetical protein LBE49_01865, partial [Deltaproteobacteria bacterium]|nr:hypothetical protein [Deltaproteobacteria bacterium]